jgi:c-di-GMP-related signal transduction protein
MPPKFIARQPILDLEMRVFAYELLFRGGPKNAFLPLADASSSSNVIADSISLSDLQMLTGDALAFVNVDQMALRLGAGRLLPPDRMVVEILETVRPTEEIVAICRALRADGYQIALDDFLDEPEMAPLVELAQFLKVDFQQSDSSARARVAMKYRDRNISLLAEKVETRKEMEEARRLGFKYFQGYFFCKPSMMEMPESSVNNLIQVQLLKAATAPDLNSETVELSLRRDSSLLYRLLRYLNSPRDGLRFEVSNISQAVALLGADEFRRWTCIFAISSMGNGKSPELVRTAITRAYFCEEITGSAGLEGKQLTLFLMGLLSVSDALLDRPLKEVLDSISVSDELGIALNSGANRLGDVFQTLLALERADWPKLASCVERLDCSEEKVAEAYQLAIQKAAAVGS